MADTFADYSDSLIGPVENAAAVTPSNSTDLDFVTRGLWVGAQGDINVDMLGGGTVVFPAVVGVLPIRVKRVRSTSTTATGIVALW